VKALGGISLWLGSNPSCLTTAYSLSERLFLASITAIDTDAKTMTSKGAIDGNSGTTGLDEGSAEGVGLVDVEVGAGVLDEVGAGVAVWEGAAPMSIDTLCVL
jgi:hypothetical protein